MTQEERSQFMEQAVPAHLLPAIKDVVHQLVLGNYALLIADRRASGWTEAALRDAIMKIIQTEGALVDLPEGGLGDIAIPVDGGGWRIDLRLWTVNGASSHALILWLDDDAGITPVTRFFAFRTYITQEGGSQAWEQAVPAHLMPAISDVVHQLVLGNDALLIADGRASDWSESVLHDKIAEIIRVQGALVDLPEGDLGDIALPVDGGGWRIDLRLWTVKGPSSYMLVLEFDDDAGIAPVRIQDIIL